MALPNVLNESLVDGHSKRARFYRWAKKIKKQWNIKEEKLIITLILGKKKPQHKTSTRTEIQPIDNARTTTEIQPTDIARTTTEIQTTDIARTTTEIQPVANPTRFRKDLLYRKMMKYYKNISDFTNRIQNFTNNGSYKIIMTLVGFGILLWLSTCIIPSYLDAYGYAMVYKYKKDLLDHLKEYDMPNFFNNTHVFYVLKQEIVYDREGVH
ncbi:unnamed protein product [Rotaria sordida]|uniref:Uncharacterized protein n=2 Tax=Rotaria sordida TaxID=392033 RepID=A0A816BER3_9BILA|nr:unnamed protein product [Rotaria sordida]CAF1610432.1 unnamed protein product [Rotaria sordida]